MEKLVELTQNKDGELFRKNNQPLLKDDFRCLGKLKTFVVENPCIDVSNEIDKRVGSNFIPEYANAYVVSDFNPDAQGIRKTENDEKIFSVYAVQFYYVSE